MTHNATKLLSPNRETGLSMFGFLMLLIVLAVALNFGLTLGPHFMDNQSINKVVESVSPSVWKGASKKKMHAAVNKGLKVNNIRGLKSEDIVKIDKKKGSTNVTVDYEVRENMIANMDVVLVFNKEFVY